MESEIGIEFPPGVRDLSADMSPPDFLKSLKRCCKFFTCLEQNQEDEKVTFRPFCDYVSSPDFFGQLTDKNTRMLVGCLFSDIFRVYAPENPFKTTEVVKDIFNFLIEQLTQLQDPKHSLFARAYHILDNMVAVQSFHMLNDIENGNYAKEIYPKLFKSMITSSSSKHDTRLKDKVLTLLSAILADVSMVSQDLLDSIWEHFLDPIPSLHPAAYETTKALIRRSTESLEGPTTAFFHAIFFQDETSRPHTRIMDHWADIFYELYNVTPLLLKECIAYFDIKLRTDNKEERLQVTKLLARMFSDKNLQFAAEHNALWKAFLGRFNDINHEIRVACVSFCRDMLLNHGSNNDYVNDIIPLIRSRRHDLDDNVRHAVVVMIHELALKNMELANEELLEFLLERVRDKKRKVRECAISSVAEIYKKQTTENKVTIINSSRVDSFKDVLLHAYFSQNIDECMAIERIMVSTLVPYTMPAKDRVTRLLQLYATVDDKGVKAINEMIQRQRSYILSPLRFIVDTLANNKEENMPMLWKQVSLLSNQLPNQKQASANLNKFVRIVDKDEQILQWLKNITSGKSSCQKVASAVTDLLKRLGAHSEARQIKLTVRQLLERTVMFLILVDAESFQYLLEGVKSCINCEFEDNALNTVQAAIRGLTLIKKCVTFSPHLVSTKESFSLLTSFLSLGEEVVLLDTLRIIKLLAPSIEKDYPDVKLTLVPELCAKVKGNSWKEAKYSVECLSLLESIKEDKLMELFDHCYLVAETNSVQSDQLRTAITVIGSIAKVLPDQTCTRVKELVSKVIVKKILQRTVTPPLSASKKRKQKNWCEASELSSETMTKIECLKCIARWVQGTPGNYAVSTLRLLQHVLANNGDLMKSNKMPTADMAYLRLSAALCVLKIARVRKNIEHILPALYEELALLVNDEVPEIRQIFITKLFQLLYSFALPPIFLSLFTMVAQEKSKDSRLRWTHYYCQLIKRYRDSNAVNASSSKIPEACIPYLIHILSSDPDLREHGINKDGLARARGSLQFMMEPILEKSHPESFGFVKRMNELLKRTRMVENKDDDKKNEVMYAVCDLTMQLVLQRSAQHAVAVIEPADKTLMRLIPQTHFTKLSLEENNVNYLPEEFRVISRHVPTPASNSNEGKKRGKDTAATNQRPQQERSLGKIYVTGGEARDKKLAGKVVVAVSKVAVATPPTVNRSSRRLNANPKPLLSSTPSISSTDSPILSKSTSSFTPVFKSTKSSATTKSGSSASSSTANTSSSQVSSWVNNIPPTQSPSMRNQPNSRLPPRKRKLNLGHPSTVEIIESTSETTQTTSSDEDESLLTVKKRLTDSNSINSSEVDISPSRPKRSKAGRNSRYDDSEYETPTKRPAIASTKKVENKKSVVKTAKSAKVKKTASKPTTESSETSSTDSQSQTSAGTRKSSRQRKKKLT